MNEYQQKLRSLGFPRKMGASEKRPVINEIDGSDGGHEVVHWDGSQDAHVKLTTFTGSAKPQEG